MEVTSICDYLGFLFLSYCVAQSGNVKQKGKGAKFEVIYQWTFLNFTWPTPGDYESAIVSGAYIPGNSIVTTAQFYKNNIYFALPRYYVGTPVTLAVMVNTELFTTNPLLQPYPNWGMNSGRYCDTFQSIHSMQIDRRGIMWVLDGNRVSNISRCPPKVFLLDLRHKGTILHYYEFPEHLSSNYGGFLNDLVIDESDGGYAYITESSDHDPGLIVYSRFQNRAWKLRDRSMFAELGASNFIASDVKDNKLINIDGIAMSPLPKRKDQDRLVYYCPITGINLFAISNTILKNERFARTDRWRTHIRYIGIKQGQSNGLIIDNEGNFYYGLLEQNAVGKWSVYEPFITAIILDQNREVLQWPDSFAFDSKGYLYVLSNGINKFLEGQISISEEIIYTLARFYTGTNSYLHNK